jgi:KDO2-lipid IV(A) lauroyltransferase
VAKVKHLSPLLEHPIAAAIRGVMTIPHVMGLEAATSIARGMGSLYPRLSPRRFQRAVDHLEVAFPEWTDERRRATAVATYQHLFRLGMEILFAPRLITKEGFTRHLELGNIEPALREVLSGHPCIMITGHCGNWELIGYAISMLGFPLHAVYRPLDLRPLDAWLHETRARRGLTLVSKFGAVRALPPVLERRELVGLVADQSGGDRGVFTPFFGRLTSTYKSIGLLALQTNARLVCGTARRLPDEPPPVRGPNGRAAPVNGRLGGMGYVIEMVDSFGPEDWSTHPDPLFYITARYRRAIELMVRRAPEQYLWMHRMWRARPAHERLNKPFPPQLREKLAALPWMTAADVEQVVARSELDREAIAAGRAKAV